MIKIFHNLVNRQITWLFLSLFIFIGFTYILLILKTPTMNYFNAKQLPLELERDDWNVYPLGCFFIQVPKEYTIVSDYRQAFGGSFYITKREEDDEEWSTLLTNPDKLVAVIGVFDSSFFLFNSRKTYFPYSKETYGSIERQQHLDGLPLDARQTQGVKIRTYYWPKYSLDDVDDINSPAKVAGHLLLPPIPLDGQFGLYIGNVLTDKEEIERGLISEIVSTVRIDQRLFGTLIDKGFPTHPLADVEAYDVGFELSYLTVPEFEELGGVMDQTPHYSWDEIDCVIGEKGLLAPNRVILDQRNH